MDENPANRPKIATVHAILLRNCHGTGVQGGVGEGGVAEGGQGGVVDAVEEEETK